jgi:hypothetical protein
MPWIDPTTINAIGTAVTGASLLNTIESKSGKVTLTFKWFINGVKHGKVDIPVFGAGGNGKSTLGDLFDGTNPFELGGSYNPSTITETVALKKEMPGGLSFLPGQENKVDKFWSPAIHRLNDGQCKGFINVVSYGYHSIETLESFAQSELYEQNQSPEEFLDAFLNDSREQEIKLMELLVDKLMISNQKIWLVTLINKQDLWFDSKEDVRNHYEKGAYYNLIKKLESKIGSQNFVSVR